MVDSVRETLYMGKIVLSFSLGPSLLLLGDFLLAGRVCDHHDGRVVVVVLVRTFLTRIQMNRG